MDKKLTPQQEQHFKLAAKQAIGYISEGNVPQTIINQSKSVGPEKAAVETVVPLMQNINAAASKAGVKIDTAVLVAVAMHVLNAIAELLVLSGVLKEGQVEAFARTVTQQAIQRHNASIGGAA